MKNILKRLNFIKIIKDMIKFPIVIYLATILLCCAAQNGWLSGNTESVEITYEMFQNILPTMMMIVPLFIFLNGLCGTYGQQLGY